MRTEYFTIADGPEFGFMGRELQQRIQYFNGIDLTIVDDPTCLKFGIGPKTQYWMKAFLWCLCRSNTERIVYIDADILPIAPFPQYVLDATAPFSARPDNDGIGDNERSTHPTFKNIKTYFNNGFFIATVDSLLMFERMKQEVHNPVHGNCIEQTWMNKYVDETCGLSPLPKAIAHIVDYEPEPEHVIMRHYCAGNKLARFKADMKRFQVPMKHFPI